MQDELTEKMHAEFTISEEDEKKLRAGCVWNMLTPNPSREEIEKMAESYSIDYETAMKWKDYWIELRKQG